MTVRIADMQMMTICNSRVCTAREFEGLFHEADPRLKLFNIHRTSGSAMTMEIRLSGS